MFTFVLRSSPSQRWLTCRHRRCHRPFEQQRRYCLHCRPPLCQSLRRRCPAAPLSHPRHGLCARLPFFLWRFPPNAIL